MDSITAALLQDTLRPARPEFIPTWNPYEDLQHGFAVANQFDAAEKARQQQALTQEEIDQLPTTRATSAALNAAKIKLLSAQADHAAALAKAPLVRAAAKVPTAPAVFTLPSWGEDSAPTSVRGATAPPMMTAGGGAPPPDPNAQDDPLPAPDAQADETTDADAEAAAPTNPTLFGPTASRPVPSVGDAPPLRTVTTFGHNLDGSRDKSDNGVTYFGDNSRNPNARIASVPIAEAIQRDKEAGGPGTLEHFRTLPPEARTVRIINPENGADVLAEVREVGPSANAKSGATADLTGRLMREVHPEDDKAKLQIGFTPLGGPTAQASPAPGDEEFSLSPISDAFPSQTTNEGVALPGQSVRIPAPAKAPAKSAFKVPENDQDVIDLQTTLAMRAEKARSQPAYSYDRNARVTIDSAIRQMTLQAQHAVATYENNQRLAAAKERAAGRGAGGTTSADPPALPGYTFYPRTFTGGRVAGDYRDMDQNETERIRRIAETNKGLDEIVRMQAGGAGMGDLLNDRGNYSDEAKAHVPGRHYFTRTSVTHDGIEQKVEQSLPEPLYQRLRSMIDPVAYGKPYPMQEGAPAPAAAAPALAAAPFNGTGPLLIAATQRGVPAVAAPQIPGVALSAPNDSAPAAVSAARGEIVPPVPVARLAPPAVPAPPAADPTLRLKALRSTQKQRDKYNSQTDERRDTDVSAAIERVAARSRKENAAPVADEVDISDFMPADLSNRGHIEEFLNDDPLDRAVSPPSQGRFGGVQGSPLRARLDAIARFVGVDNYDFGAAVKLIRQRRDQAILDALSKGEQPEILSSADKLAAQMQAHTNSLTAGTPETSVGGRDRIIPDSRTKP